MKPTRFLVLLSLQSSRREAGDTAADAPYLAAIAESVRSAMTDVEAISVGRVSAFVGLDSGAATDVFKRVAKGLRQGDVVHVIELGKDLATTHTALANWQARTGWLV